MARRRRLNWRQIKRKIKRFRFGRVDLSNPKHVRYLQMFAIAMFASVIMGILLVGFLFAWYARDLPRPDKIVRRDGFSTRIFDREGELLYDVFDEQRRTPIEFEDIPEHLKLGVISIEDQNFYGHGGYDPKGIFRAFLVTVFQGRKQGGSTITQQLVKNVLLTSDRKISRKIKEFVLSVQIERLFNKDEIITMYLNEAPYGGTIWGAGTAAELYFGKDLKDLTLVESAILAGMPQRPSVYSPFTGKNKAYEGRTQEVLRRMREDGYITREQEDEARVELEEIEFRSSNINIKAPHFVFYVVDELEEMFGENYVEQAGLQVTTTLDLEFHDVAQEIVTEEVADVADLDVGNGAAVVMDPQTGQILSMVGSKDFFADDYDGQVNVAMSLRQPGSTIKPVTYMTAFEQGYTPASMLMDTPTEFPGGANNPAYKPVNYDGNYYGPVSLRKALASSLNVPAVKLLAQVGVENMLGRAYEIGFDTLEPSDENLARFGLSVTLGGGEVRLLDLVESYSSFANGGRKVEPVAVLEVKDRSGNTLFKHKDIAGKQVIDEEVAFLINDVLSDNNARLLSFGANSLLNMSDRPVAVKTGTTNDRRDNWTIGWSDSVMVGVWVGNNDNSQMKGVASGVTGASPIWRRIILEGLGRWTASPFTRPSGVETANVDVVSGYPEHDGFPARQEFYIRGTLPPLPDPIHQKLKLCPGENKLATAGMVDGGNYDEKEFYTFFEDDPFASDGDENRWQKGIDEWLVGQGDEKYHPPTEKCDGESAVVRIYSPEHQKNYDGDKVEIHMGVFGEKKLEKLEILIDGDVRETLKDGPYKTELKLDPGSYKLQGRAVLEGGDTVTSGELRFGIGGVDWDFVEPTPTPSPSPSPSPSPTPDP